MTFDSQSQDALDDEMPGLRCLVYQSSAGPTRHEAAPIHSELAETILNALGRDDRLRWTYVRRRWQGLSD
jgi:hypothetical protein